MKCLRKTKIMLHQQPPGFSSTNPFFSNTSTIQQQQNLSQQLLFLQQQQQYLQQQLLLQQQKTLQLLPQQPLQHNRLEQLNHLQQQQHNFWNPFNVSNVMLMSNWYYRCQIGCSLGLFKDYSMFYCILKKFYSMY